MPSDFWYLLNFLLSLAKIVVHVARAFPSSRPSVESPKVFPVTTDGESGVVSNGVPDWVYEGEFLAA